MSKLKARWYMTQAFNGDGIGAWHKMIFRRVEGKIKILSYVDREAEMEETAENDPSSKRIEQATLN